MTIAAVSFPLTMHQGFARAVLIYSIVLAAWGLFLYVRGRNPSGGLLGALIILEGLIVLQGVFGLVLLGVGHRPQSGLHYLYGLAALLTLPGAYFMSAGGRERRDSMVFGLAALFLVGVAIRGVTTGGT
jgi:heme A synthase